MPGEKRFLGHAEFLALVLRQINAVLLQIDADILPEIRELQAGADVVGEHVQLLVAHAVQQQDEPPDRIRAAAAIIEHLGEIRVAALDHVLLEGGEQIGEER